jgi:hypothetical protein
VDANLDEPFVDGLGQETLGQVPGEDFREERHDIDPQGGLHRTRGQESRVWFRTANKKSGKDHVLPLASFFCF